MAIILSIFESVKYYISNFEKIIINMFSKNLRILRNIKKLTQLELAKMLNVSYKTISHWEAGYSEPSLDMLVKIKTVLDVSYEELLE